MEAPTGVKTRVTVGWTLKLKPKATEPTKSVISVSKGKRDRRKSGRGNAVYFEPRHFVFVA